MLRSCFPRRRNHSRSRGCRSVRSAVRKSANEFHWSWWVSPYLIDLSLILGLCASRSQCHKASILGRRTPLRGTNVPVAGLGPGLGVSAVLPFGHERGHLGTSREIELHKDVAHVVLHCLLGEMHLLADLTVGHSLGDKPDDASLLRGQLLNPTISARPQDIAPDPCKDLAGHRWIEQ